MSEECGALKSWMTMEELYAAEIDVIRSQSGGRQATLIVPKSAVQASRRVLRVCFNSVEPFSPLPTPMIDLVADYAAEEVDLPSFDILPSRFPHAFAPKCPVKGKRSVSFEFGVGWFQVISKLCGALERLNATLSQYYSQKSTLDGPLQVYFTFGKQKYGVLRVQTNAWNLREPEEARWAPSKDDLTHICGEDISLDSIETNWWADRGFCWIVAEHLVNRAEQEAQNTCERCGQPGEIQDVRGWLRCLCPECHQARMKTK